MPYPKSKLPQLRDFALAHSEEPLDIRDCVASATNCEAQPRRTLNATGGAPQKDKGVNGMRAERLNTLTR